MIRVFFMDLWVRVWDLHTACEMVKLRLEFFHLFLTFFLSFPLPSFAPLSCHAGTGTRTGTGPGTDNSDTEREERRELSFPKKRKEREEEMKESNSSE